MPEVFWMKKILIVEDDETVLELLRTVLKFHGSYEPGFAMDGVPALDLVKPTRPDLVIIDVQLPSMDGIEVCRCIKSDPALQDTKVMILTGMVQESDRLQAEQAGADEYITKPFHTSAIMNTVARLID
jgi:two-component system cell cycle response regulator DivK